VIVWPIRPPLSQSFSPPKDRPRTKDQIFTQLVLLRHDIGNMRHEVNEKFESMERRLRAWEGADSLQARPSVDVEASARGGGVPEIEYVSDSDYVDEPQVHHEDEDEDEDEE